MTGKFDYLYTTSAVGQLEINDLGNCAVIANDDRNVCYYLVIKTELGSSIVMEAGPFIPDEKVLVKSVNINFKRLDYNESKLSTIVDKFLNNPYRNITQAREVDENEIYPHCIDIVDYMKNNRE